MTMWKKFVLLTLLTVFTFNLYAHNPAIVFMGQPIFKNVKTTPLQLTVWPMVLFEGDIDICGIHLATSPLAWQKRLYGVSAGFIMGSEKLCGLSVSGASFGGRNYGCSIALYNHWEKFSALSIGLVNRNHSHNGESRNILQIGVFNYAKNGLQIGLLNYNPNAFIPWMPLFNFSFSAKADK